MVAGVSVTAAVVGSSVVVVEVETVVVLVVVVDSSSSGSTADQASVTVSHVTSGVNRLMLVGVTMEPGGESVTSVTYNGVNLSLVGVEQDPSNNVRVEIWSLVAPDIGTAAELTITNSNNNKKSIVETIMDNGKYRLLFFLLVTSAIVNIYFCA